MPTTSNFGWTTPADTDLVKDGAAAIRTLGNGIDTSFLDLKGGTTNQVLAKNSNTDLDFKWVADASGIPATIFDAKGDIIAATAADTADRLAVGTNGQVLTADSTASTGLKWATPAGANASYTLLNAGGTALTGSGTITISGISNYERFLILVQNASSATAGVGIRLRINADSGANQYDWAGGLAYNSTTYSTGVFDSTSGPSTYIPLGDLSSNAASTVSAGIYIDGGNATGTKSIQVTSGATNGGGSSHSPHWLAGIYKGSATISSISVLTGSGNFDNGTIYIYGSAN